jgi:uncharacterized damage-inducible protein DinB
MGTHHTLSDLQTALRNTQAQLLEILVRTPDALLHTRPAPERWSQAENLAHVTEYRRFFTNEANRVLEHPGDRMGRTITDPQRAAWIQHHAQDSRDAIKRGLEDSFETTMGFLNRLSDEQLETRGQHVNSKFGEQSLREFISHFITEHDAKHVVQAQGILEQVELIGSRS